MPLIPYAKPGTQKANKTGNWRSKIPIVDREKCISCMICQCYCPEIAMSGQEETPRRPPVIDLDYCKGCGICAELCPVKAIIMEDEVR